MVCDMAEKLFKSGEVIFMEGTYEPCMYELLTGTVGIYAHYGQENEKLLTELKAENDACFGEMGLIEAWPRSATAVALEDVKVEVVTGDAFGAYFKERPERIYAIMAQMGGRIRALSNDYLEACRAAAEVMDTADTGKGKSGWFMEKVRKLMDDYERAYIAGVEAGSSPYVRI